METKNLSVVSKSSTGRVVRFIGSDESLDRDGDTVSIDGWDVKDYMKNPIVLYGHDYYALPIAKTVSVTVDKRARQLLFDVEFPTIEELSTNPKTPSEHALKVDAIYNMAKAGILNTVSVGFKGLDYEPTSTGRHYIKQSLMELSIVPIPANPNAVAVMRAAKITDAIMKGVLMTTKGNKKLSKESRAFLAERVTSLEKALEDLKGFIADDPEEGEEPAEENDKSASGADTKEYVIEFTEKDSDHSDEI